MDILYYSQNPGNRYETWSKRRLENMPAAQNDWCGMSLDEKRGVSFPRLGLLPSLPYGQTVKGEIYMEIVLLPLTRQQWKAQMAFSNHIHHDLWDYVDSYLLQIWSKWLKMVNADAVLKLKIGFFVPY